MQANFHNFEKESIYSEIESPSPPLPMTTKFPPSCVFSGMFDECVPA